MGKLSPKQVENLTEPGTSCKSSLGLAIGAFAGGAYCVVLIAALLLPETKGRTLD
ncbi:hypothetical protein [Pseudomonas sp. NA-150]|uniref:hypothetical protein n=1 Tax=Pseudomonas sp. NA-150 TaxID=3367525 RepID=UPI0037CAFA15